MLEDRLEHHQEKPCGNRPALVAFSLGALALGQILGMAPAQAQNTHYAVVCLRNDTRANISYMRKSGDGQWERRFLAPGGVWRIAHRYDFANENRSPKIRVQYDSDARGSNFQQSMELTRYRAVGDTCQEAKVYAFRYEQRNQNFITLAAVN